MDVVLRAHPVRGESHIQRNANGGVAIAPSEISKVSVNVASREALLKNARDFKISTELRRSNLK